MSPRWNLEKPSFLWTSGWPGRSERFPEGECRLAENRVRAVLRARRGAATRKVLLKKGSEGVARKRFMQKVLAFG